VADRGLRPRPAVRPAGHRPDRTALTALPGPLTIPPVLIGLWIWSSEFEWAARFFAVFKRKAQDAWRHARQHPASSAAVTVGGLAAAGVAFWAVGHYQVVDQAKVALSL
jgi:hypothetical protein